MIYIYILLTIIAIGVLLVSEAGQEILRLLGWLVAIGGILYLGFWAVMFVIGLLSSEDIRDSVYEVTNIIIPLAVIASLTYALYKKYKKK